MPRNKKAALFVRCTDEEADRIRRAARAERRTVSGYILNAVFNRIEIRNKLIAEQDAAARSKIVSPTPKP